MKAKCYVVLICQVVVGLAMLSVAYGASIVNFLHLASDRPFCQEGVGPTVVQPELSIFQEMYFYNCALCTLY
jgi:hypothetical protein